ncbi:hypothetical protein [Ralstonia phage phiRSL1]|uniref:Uncharacterized protein n=1 Tax=Ralstonia phage phiRSL1 TaxID=1980924 RepID=B2ZYC5_9CAUD|nr:hypothetical protein RSL1_ORF299 [Ralstonia phage phiRSL1]BAG41745.1 hypothetical protein [Ralstonia phage phiRSL1]
MGINRISMTDLEASGERGSVWVLNTAQESQYELKGEIIINVPNAQGKGEPLRVPESWLPFDATSRFPKTRLLDSTDFRSAVVNGLIAVIDEKSATSILNEPGAREERQRLQQFDKHVREASGAKPINEKLVSITNPNRDNQSNTTPVELVGGREETVAALAKAGAKATNGMKPQFMAFFEKTKMQADTEALNSIRNRGKMSRKELRYLRDNLPDHHVKTKKAVKGRLSALRAAGATTE